LFLLSKYNYLVKYDAERLIIKTFPLKGPKTDVRIGSDGNPLSGEPNLGAQARKALKRLLDEILGLFS